MGKNTSTPVNLHMVAEIAGVHPSTVSRALKKNPQISKKTCKRIQKIADEMGYRPDVFAQVLVNRRSSGVQQLQGNLVCLLGHEDRNPLHHLKDYQIAFEGAKHRANQQGFSLDSIWVYHPELSGKRLHGVLGARSVQGILLLGIHANEVDIPWSQYVAAAVHFGRSPIKEKNFSAAKVDPYQMAYLGTQKVIEMGYQNPGLAMWETQEWNADNRFFAGINGYIRNVKGTKSQFKEPFYWNPIAPETNGKRFISWLSAKKPDVVVTVYASSGILIWLKEAGIRVPEDIGVIDLALAPGVGSVSGVVLPYEELGSATVDLIVAGIYRSERGLSYAAKSVVLESQWSAGKTTRKL